MIVRKIASLAGLCIFLPALLSVAQTPGQNINMVSGTSFPTGDPFLQRQNEPSIAVSSRNSSRLLAGSNDYRSVNIPAPPGVKDETGDAWLGVFKSFDGGATWQSNLLPGYPQDISPEGLASPLHGFTTGADPVVRAGTNGVFYYAGIAFDRGTNIGAIFVARYMDLANKENGDSIAYLGTTAVERGTSKTFIDKPWLAIDIPRGEGTCRIETKQDGKTVTQTIPAGTIYVSYSAFIGGADSSNAQIRVSHSNDCGQTWTPSVNISRRQVGDDDDEAEDNDEDDHPATQVNQGSSMVIDPQTGAVYVAWRAFVNRNLPDAIFISKSVDGGRHFSKPVRVQVLPRYVLNSTAPAFFDQPISTSSFRSNGFPSLAIDGSGRLYLAWSQRGFGPGGDARIVLTTSPNGVTWTSPQPIDNAQVLDDFGNPLERGEQFMPSLTFSEGKLMALYYDQRLDHTVGEFTPNDPFAPAMNGSFYKQARVFVGDLPGSPNLVFTPFLADFGLTIRHTIDTRVSQADPGPSPTFNSVYVSQYKFGTLGDEQPAGTVTHLQQLQLNPPNLPMFMGGTVPFIGDYIDITGRAFKSPGETGKGWQFNTAATQSPVHFATWTSNQDVRPPADLHWDHYTPPGPGCIPGQEGDKNQNIYFSRITQGLVFSSPQLSKPLSTTLPRAFVLDVFNGTKLPHIFRLTIANQPAGGTATFNLLPTPLPAVLPPPVTSIDLALPPNSGATRSVFALSTDAGAMITVTATEITAVGGGVMSNGLTGFVVLNSDPTVPALVNPDSSPGNINTLELYTPNLSNPNLSNPNLSNPNLSNPNLSNPNLSNPNLSNPNLSNPNLSNPNLSNANVTNANVANPNLSNPNLSNPNLSNASISDITYSVSNKGNTNAAYQIRLLQVGDVPSNAHIQLIMSKTYLTPIGDNCKLLEEPTNIIAASITNPVFISTGQLGMNTTNAPDTGNASLHLAPGETATITIRGAVDLQTMQTISSVLVPAVRAQAANNVAVPLTLIPMGLTNAIAGQDYTTTFNAVGGTPPYTWSVAEGSQLPPGFTLDTATGKLSNANPAQNVPGTYNFTLQVTDSAHPANVATRAYSLTVLAPPPLVFGFTSLPDAISGQPYFFRVTATGGVGPYVWTVTNGALPYGLMLTSDGNIAGVTTATGTTFTLSVHDSSAPQRSASGVFSINVRSPLQITTAELPSGRIEEPYSVTLKASGGTGTLTWSLVSGSLPAGLSLSSDGTISGKPAEVEGAEGPHNFTVQVMDSSATPQTAMRGYTLVVLPDDDTHGPED